MSLARVYRPVRDWKNQRPKDLEESYIGDVTGVIMGGAAPADLARFPNVASTEGQCGIPFEQDSNILVQQGDLLVIRDVMYEVSGPRQWEDEHEFTGPASDVVSDYYWVYIRTTRGAP